jgi:hypothetical protein
MKIIILVIILLEVHELILAAILIILEGSTNVEKA